MQDVLIDGQWAIDHKTLEKIQKFSGRPVTFCYFKSENKMVERFNFKYRSLGQDFYAHTLEHKKSLFDQTPKSPG